MDRAWPALTPPHPRTCKHIRMVSMVHVPYHTPTPTHPRHAGLLQNHLNYCFHLVWNVLAPPKTLYRTLKRLDFRWWGSSGQQGLDKSGCNFKAPPTLIHVIETKKCVHKMRKHLINCCKELKTTTRKSSWDWNILTGKAKKGGEHLVPLCAASLFGAAPSPALYDYKLFPTTPVQPLGRKAQPLLPCFLFTRIYMIPICV